jgi:hypothetical protein
MPFSWDEKYRCWPTLFSTSNTVMQLSSEVKYLTRDNWMAWTGQLDVVASKAYGAFWTFGDTFWENMVTETRGNVLDLRRGFKTHSYLWFHCVVVKTTLAGYKAWPVSLLLEQWKLFHQQQLRRLFDSPIALAVKDWSHSNKECKT